jgi:hypothetical protein
MPPSSLYAADDEAREVTERLIRDAGYEPVNLGGLESARALEDSVTGLFLKISPVFYRFAGPASFRCAADRRRTRRANPVVGDRRCRHRASSRAPLPDAARVKECGALRRPRR